MLLLSLLALSLQAAAPTAASSSLAWVRKPTAEEVRAAYPAAAAAQGVGGLAYLRCRVAADTTLKDCVGYGEAPQGAGFAGAALPLSAAWRIRSDPPGQTLLIPIRFDPIPPAEGALPVDLHVTWTAAPTRAEVEAVYPKSAKATGANGMGVMACAVSGGQLIDCHAAKDDAFSRAAVRLAPRFGIGPTFGDARKTEGLVLNVPVAFGAAGGAKPRGAAAAALPWISQPTADQIAAAFPVAAAQQGYTAVSASARCIAGADGSLQDCQATHEEPVGVGGAQAVIRLSLAYRVSIWTPEGLPTAGRAVEISVVTKPR